MSATNISSYLSCGQPGEENASIFSIYLNLSHQHVKKQHMIERRGGSGRAETLIKFNRKKQNGLTFIIIIKINSLTKQIAGRAVRFYLLQLNKSRFY